jgi:hypothetical protein
MTDAIRRGETRPSREAPVIKHSVRRAAPRAEEGARAASTIRAMLVALLAAAAAACATSGNPALARLEDRALIETAIERYMRGLDLFDEELYASAFFEDGEFLYEGELHRGHDAMREVIADRAAGRDAAAARGEPERTTFHVHLNSRLEFLDADTAVHHAYWATIERFTDGRIGVASAGSSVDRLEQRDGDWRILRRELYDDPR